MWREKLSLRLPYSPEGSTSLWHSAHMASADDLLAIARQNVTRSLSDEECRQYLHVAACSVP